MRYPKFLSKNDTIGITALSAGLGKYKEDYYKSIENIKKNGFRVLETTNVLSSFNPSSSPEQRIIEFNELLTNDDISMVICASGGDFLYEIMPYINYDIINKNPKWIMGASDPTYLLYTVTTNLDIATIYAFNAASFDAKDLHESQKICLDFIKGNIVTQSSYKKYESNKRGRINNNYNLDTDSLWESINGDFEITGRIIGGCIECLKLLPGTKYDKTNKFIEKYKNDGIIWYFDVFNTTSEDFYLTLLHLKESGWFKYIKGVIVGRVKFPNNYTEMTYQQALLKVFGEIPLVFNADIGHVPPKMTIINGAIAKIKYKNKKSEISQYLI